MINAAPLERHLWHPWRTNGRRRYRVNEAASPGKTLRQGLWTYFKYTCHSWIPASYEFLISSTYRAQTAFWTYLFLHETNRALDAGPMDDP